MRKSARALIIKNKKLLLVGNSELGILWSPGGGIEGSETPLEALKRELKEEVGLKLKSAKHYIDHIHKDPTGESKDRDMKFFIVEAEGTPAPNNEVEIIYWYSRQDYEVGKPKVSPTISSTIVPKLIEDGLL
jgi:8-oxo-dGTP diphosphatase